MQSNIAGQPPQPNQPPRLLCCTSPETALYLAAKRDWLHKRGPTSTSESKVAAALYTIVITSCTHKEVTLNQLSRLPRWLLVLKWYLIHSLNTDLVQRYCPQSGSVSLENKERQRHYWQSNSRRVVCSWLRSPAVWANSLRGLNPPLGSQRLVMGRRAWQRATGNPESLSTEVRLQWRSLLETPLCKGFANLEKGSDRRRWYIPRVPVAETRV